MWKNKIKQIDFLDNVFTKRPNNEEHKPIMIWAIDAVLDIEAGLCTMCPYITNNPLSKAKQCEFDIPGINIKIHFDSQYGDRNILFLYAIIRKFAKDLYLEPVLIEFANQMVQNLSPNSYKVYKNMMKTKENEQEESNWSVLSTMSNIEIDPFKVIANFHLESSTIRLNCKPVSFMQVLIHVPRVDAHFSTTVIMKNSAYVGKSFLHPKSTRRFDMKAVMITGQFCDFFFSIHNSDHVFNPNHKTEVMESDNVLSFTVQYIRFHVLRQHRRIKNKKSEANERTKISSYPKGIQILCTIDIGETLFHWNLRRVNEVTEVMHAWNLYSLLKAIMTGIEKVKVGSELNLYNKLETEAMLLFMIRAKEVHIIMDMLTRISTNTIQMKEFHMVGDLEFDSKFYKRFIIISTLDQYRLASNSEMVVCLMDMDKLTIRLEVHETKDVNPIHMFGVGLNQCSLLMSYFGMEMLVSKLVNCSGKVKCSAVLKDNRFNSILMKIDAQCGLCQLIVSKSTIHDLLQIYSSIKSFAKSKWMRNNKYQQISSMMHKIIKVEFHNWHKCYNEALSTGNNSDFLCSPFSPKFQISADSTCGFKVAQIALFHGSSFTVKSWVLLLLNNFVINLTNNCKKQKDQLISDHNINFKMLRSDRMCAKIYKISRDPRCNLDNIKSFKEWIGFIFTEKEGIFTHLKKRLTSVATASHTSEKILVLPPIELVFTSNHAQIYNLKKYIAGSTSQVGCEMSINLDDFIDISIDANLLMFVKDILKIRNKDPFMFMSNTDISGNFPPDRSKQNEMFTELKNNREFLSNLWRFDPKIRLISLGGHQVNVFGISFILDKLNFSQAQEKVPYYIQTLILDHYETAVSDAMLFYVKRLLQVQPASPSKNSS